MPKYTLKTIVENLEDVPDAYRDRYKEQNGRFHLEEIEVDDAAEIRGALERERRERREAKAALEKYKDIDPERAREALDKVQELEDRKLRDKGEYDQLRKRLQEQQTRELSARDTRISELEKGLRQYQLTDKVRAAALKAGVFPEDVDDVIKLTSDRFDLQDGQIVVLEDGVPTSSTPETFFSQTFKEQKPKFYAASGAGGSGAPPGGSSAGAGRQKTIKRDAFDRMGHGDRMTFIKDGGQVTD